MAHDSAVNEELAGTMEMANTVTNAKSSDPASTADFDDGGGQCGWYCWKPKFLQRLSTSKSFLFWICWAGGFQSKSAKSNNNFVYRSVAFPSFPPLQLKVEKERGEMLSFGKVVMNCLFVCSFPK